MVPKSLSLFDIDYMILSLLTDNSLMKDENLAPGYDIFTGEVSEDHPASKNMERYTLVMHGMIQRHDLCGSKGKCTPLALILFEDKTHTDLHGPLSVTPVILPLTLFNCAARNNRSFWRPLTYIPNLSNGKDKADTTESKGKV